MTKEKKTLTEIIEELKDETESFKYGVHIELLPLIEDLEIIQSDIENERLDHLEELEVLENNNNE